MGNMSNPVITRLGLSQFWYKHWYSDIKINFHENLKLDSLFEKLVILYLDYGFTLNSNLFLHEYWYHKTKLIKFEYLKSLKFLHKFYRRFYYSNTTLSIEHSFFIGHESKEYFPLRVWILKYFNWVIISFKSFKPDKRKLDTRFFSKKNNTNLPFISVFFSKKNKTLLLKRIKLYYMYNKSFTKKISNTYYF